MKVVSRSTSGTVTATASTSPRSIVTPRIVKTCCWASIRSGTLDCEPPLHSRPTFCRMNDMPTAVISGASFGAERSGR